MSLVRILVLISVLACATWAQAVHAGIVSQDLTITTSHYKLNIGDSALWFKGKSNGGWLTLNETLTVTAKGDIQILASRALDAGAVIDGSGTWLSSVQLDGRSTRCILWFCAYTDSGLWSGDNSGYLAFRFTDEDGIHYGWVELVSYASSVSIGRWAYESVAAVAVKAGSLSTLAGIVPPAAGSTPVVVAEPSILGLVVLPFIAMLLWRLRARFALPQSL